MRIVLVIFLLLSTILIDKVKPSSIFDYSQAGQTRWVKNYPMCAGDLQSPITISASISIPLPLPALELIGYRNFLRPPLMLRNNGHTVVLKIKDQAVRKRTPYIFGALLKENDEYELESLHFHWGLKNNRGSEHVLHGTRYPLEMHLVHRNKKYNDIETALQYEDGLAVLGVFFHLVEEINPALQPLLAHFQEVQKINTQTQLNSSLKLSTLLPTDLETYYTYRGSLTTPPCNEVVTWTVLASTVPVAFNQMSKFRTLSDGKGILIDNYRRLQEIKRRKIFVRRPDTVFASRNKIVDVNPSTLKWFWT